MGGRVVSLRAACLALDSTSEPDVETLCWCPGREVLSSDPRTQRQDGSFRNSCS
jgi:hypothetical protein